VSERPDWDEYWIGVAKAVSARSDCERDKVGAVVVKDRRVRATGYNGAAAGKPGCATCPRRQSGVPKDSSYDTGAGQCVALHAEMNAIIYCNREDLPGATIYVTREPCAGCMKMIVGAGIESVVFPTEVGDE
jgi:dCMP deaminase